MKDRAFGLLIPFYLTVGIAALPTRVTTSVTTTAPIIVLGDNCTTDAACSNNILNTTCKNNICVCPDGTFEDGNSCPLGTAYKIIKLSKRSKESDTYVTSFDENCTVASNKPCNKYANLFCDNSTHKCMCTTDHLWNVSTCVSVDELKPVNLVVTSLDVHSINISWNQPNDLNDLVLTYKVMWSSRNGIDNSSSNELTSQLQFSIPVNQPGDLYDITVTTILKSQNTSASDMRTQRSVPPAPTGITAVNTSVADITVSWNFTGIAVGFNGSLVSSKQSQSFNELVTERLKKFTGLEAGTKYNFSITAYSSNTSLQGDSTQYSEEVTAVFRTFVDVPEVPSSVNLFDVCNKSISLTVGTPDRPYGEIIGYLFQKSSRVYDDLPFTNTKVEFRNLSSNYSFSGLTPGTFYKFLVFAVNERFNSIDAFNETFRTIESEPGVVYINDTQPTANDVRLMWNRPAQPNGDIIGYRIYINNIQNNTDCIEVILRTTNSQSIPSKYLNCGVAISGTVTKNQLSVQEDVMGLTPSQTYSAYITALTIAGEGDPTVTTFMTIIAVPDKVTNVMGAAVSPTSILVSWTKPRIRPGPTTYTVTTYDVIDSKNISNTCTSKDFDITKCTVNDLDEYWQYQFFVTMMTSAGSNTTRIDNTVTTLPARPGYVQDVATKGYNFGADNCIDTKIDIEWREPNQRDRNSRIIGYDIYEQGLGNNLQQKEAYPGFDTYRKDNEQFKVTIQGLQPDVSYSFKIRAEIQNGTLKTRFTVSIKIAYTIEKCPLATPMVILIVLVVLVLLCSITAVSYVCYTKRRYVGRSTGGKNDPYTDLHLKPAISKREPRKSELVYTSLNQQTRISRKRPIYLSNIYPTVAEMHKDSGLKFTREFEELVALSPAGPSTVAFERNNRRKNRNLNTVPFDASRVKLFGDKNKTTGNNYINACHIQTSGKTSSQTFIATQNPLPNTIDDFWTMIWDQNATIIVMITKEMEEKEEQMARYFPMELNAAKQFGSFNIQTMSKFVVQDFELISVKVKKGHKSRTVKHFKCSQWNDLYDDTLMKIVTNFIEVVRSNTTQTDKLGPTVVHCSDGAGPTGIYLALSQLIDAINDDTVDMFDLVLTLRESRLNIVENEQQYIFIHDCLVYILDNRKTTEDTISDSFQHADTYDYINCMFDIIYSHRSSQAIKLLKATKDESAFHKVLNIVENRKPKCSKNKLYKSKTYVMVNSVIFYKKSLLPLIPNGTNT